MRLRPQICIIIVTFSALGLLVDSTAGAPMPQKLSRFSNNTFTPDGEIFEFITFPVTPQEFFVVDPVLESPLDSDFGAIRVGANLTRGVLVTRDNRPAPGAANEAGQSGFRDRPGSVGNLFIPTGFNVGRVFASYNPDAYNGQGAYFLAMDISAPGIMDPMAGTQPVAFDVDGNGSRSTQTEIAAAGTVSEAPKAEDDRYTVGLDTNGDSILDVKVSIIERRSAMRVGAILIDPPGGQIIDGVTVRRSVMFEDRTGTLPGDAKSQAVLFLDTNQDGTITREDFGIGSDIELVIRNVHMLPNLESPNCVVFTFTADSFDDEPLGGGAEELVRLEARFPQPDIEATKLVRCVGQQTFSNQVRAAPDSQVEFEIKVQNWGNVDLDAMISDALTCTSPATLTTVANSCQVVTAPAGFGSAAFCTAFHAALANPASFPISVGTLRAGDACLPGLGEELVFRFRALVGPAGFSAPLCDNEIDCRNGVSVTATTTAALDGILAPFGPSLDSPDANSEEEDCSTAACCTGIPGCVPNDGIGDVRDEFAGTATDQAGMIDTPREQAGMGDDNVVTLEVECRGIALTKEVHTLPNGRFVTGTEALPLPVAPVDLEYRHRVVNSGELPENVTIIEGSVCDDIAALQLAFPGQVSFLTCPLCTGATPGRVSGIAAAMGGMFDALCGIRFTGEQALRAFMQRDDSRPACRALTPGGSPDDSCYRNCSEARAVLVDTSGVCAGPEIRSESFSTVCHETCAIAVTKQVRCLDDCTRRNPIGTLQDSVQAVENSCVEFQVTVSNASADSPVCRLRISDTLSNQPAHVVFDNDVRFRIGATNCNVPAGFNVTGVPFEFSPATDCAMAGGLAPGQSLAITFKARIPDGADRNVTPANTVTVDGAAFCPTTGAPSFTCMGNADATVDILEPRLTCIDKNWEIQGDTDGDCDPDGPFHPGGDVVDLGGVLFPALLRFTIRAANPGDVAINAVASDPILSACVASLPGVDFSAPPACELGASKMIAPSGMAQWVCQIRVESANDMRALAGCDGVVDNIFRNAPTVEGQVVAGTLALCTPPMLRVVCEGELDTPVLAPPDCEMTVNKDVKCSNEPDTAYATSIQVLPGSSQTFRIRVNNDSDEVQLPQVCITDTLSCDSLLVAGSVSAFIGASNVTACFLPVFPASLDSGARACYTFAACRPAMPWIGPGETLTLTFRTMVPADFATVGPTPDCTNLVRVESYEDACDDLPPAGEACATGTDNADFDVRIPAIACAKDVCPDFNNDGFCDRGFSSDLLLPSNIAFPFSVQYRLTVFNSGETPLENVQVCDPALLVDATAAGLVPNGCSLSAPGGCSTPASLDPGSSMSFGCKMVVPTRAAWDMFAGRDEDDDSTCYSNAGSAMGLADGSGICSGDSAIPVNSRGCTSRVCLPPPELGACCRTDGTCTISPEDECTRVGNTYLGDDTMCEGDNNGNGIDDACEEPIPTVSEWGILILALLLASAAKIRRFEPCRVFNR